MPKFKFTSKAVKDLSDIWNYTVETWSEGQADKYYKLLMSACTAIAKKPKIDNFKIAVQPYFCIIDSNGNVLSDIGETKSPKELRF